MQLSYYTRVELLYNKIMLRSAMNSKPYDKHMLLRRETSSGNAYIWHDHDDSVDELDDVCYHEVIRHALPNERAHYVAILFLDIDYKLETDHDVYDLDNIIFFITLGLMNMFPDTDMTIYNSSVATKVSLHVLFPKICCLDHITMKDKARRIAENLPEYGKYIDLNYQSNKTLRIPYQCKLDSNAKKRLHDTRGKPVKYVLEYFYNRYIPDDVVILESEHIAKVRDSVNLEMNSSDLDDMLKAISPYVDISNIKISSAKSMNNIEYYGIEYINVKSSKDCPLCERRHDKNSSLYISKFKRSLSLRCYRQRDDSKLKYITLSQMSVIDSD